MFRDRLYLGMTASIGTGLALCLMVRALDSSRWFGPTGLALSTASLMLVPVFMGMVAAWFWKPLRLSKGKSAGYAALTTLAAIGASAAFLGEGIICLIILSPILFAGVLGGAQAMERWLRNRNDRLHVSVLPVFALAIVAEPSFRQPYSSVVTDEIVIAAPAAKIWPHVLAFEPIQAAPDYWLFKIGLPYPVATTNSGNYVGAERACIFSGGAVFKEKVIELETERLLTFEIVEQPPDPELIGHLNSRRGQFEIRPNADGTCTLIGRTWYTLHVSPAWYFDWWIHDIFRAVHLRVMNNVKELAERK